MSSLGTSFLIGNQGQLLHKVERVKKWRLGQQVVYVYKRNRRRSSKLNIQSTNQSNKPINQQFNNQLNVNRLQKILAFQEAFSNFSILIPSVIQVFGKFSIVLFHSFVVKSNIFSSNFSIMVASSIQVYIKFPAQYCKSYSSLSTFSIMSFHSFIRKSNPFLQ